jgi:tetratricopeptide (TPR) repeat protein
MRVMNGVPGLARNVGWRVLLVAGLVAPLCAQIDPRTALLERAGWDAIEAGRAHAAAAAFEEALAADPKNPQLALGAGTAAYLERRDADAEQLLERALTLDPELIAALDLIGQVRYRRGDLAGAIRAYETLAARSADADVAAALDRWRREAELHDRMRQAVGQHFTVSFEGPQEEALAAKALESLERAYFRIGDVFATYPNEPIAVVLYTGEQFRDITRSPAWAAGAFDGTIRVPMRGALGKDAELDRIMAHEFTHALIRGLAPRGVPTWLNEGLAAALESPDPAPASNRPAAIVPLAALQSSFGRLSDRDAQIAYRSSAEAARRLLEDAGGIGVANLLRDLGAGIAFDTAFLHRIQRTLPEFEASLNDQITR